MNDRNKGQGAGRRVVDVIIYEGVAGMILQVMKLFSVLTICQCPGCDNVVAVL